MCLAQGPQRSDTCEARTRGLSVSSQALYHWAHRKSMEALCRNGKHMSNTVGGHKTYVAFPFIHM